MLFSGTIQSPKKHIATISFQPLGQWTGCSFWMKFSQLENGACRVLISCGDQKPGATINSNQVW
jgi:hypothetical protein